MVAAGADEWICKFHRLLRDELSCQDGNDREKNGIPYLAFSIRCKLQSHRLLRSH